eukprot:m51a1_g858 putative dual specificity protein phosphatase 1 isoform 2 (260) ;mRNA; f:798439-799507
MMEQAHPRDVLNALICHHATVLDARPSDSPDRVAHAVCADPEACDVVQALDAHGRAWRSLPLLVLGGPGPCERVLRAVGPAGVAVRPVRGGAEAVLACYPFLSLSAPAPALPLSECPCEVPPGAVYVGGINAREWVHALGITHVLNCCGEGVPLGAGVHEKVCAVEDESDERISGFFPVAYDFIEEARSKGGRVLVHCAMGLSRSAVIACAYMIRRYGMNHYEALKEVQRHRPSINPNPGFLKQLYMYHIALRTRKRTI